MMPPEQLKPERKHYEWRVVSPGRVNLLGEHVDYNQGIVLPAAIDRFVELHAVSRKDRVVMLDAIDMNDSVCFSLDDLMSRSDINGKPLPLWALYPAGVAWALQNAQFIPQGVEVEYQSNIPIGAGLSSSAAVELAFGVLWQAIGSFDMTRMQLAQLCQRAENHYVGVNCGLMDQFACSHGVARHALYFDVRSLEWQPLPLPPETVIVIADSGIPRQLADSHYNQRRSECEQAVKLLKTNLPAINSLRDVTQDQFEQYGKQLPNTLYMRARHVIDEIERVRSACYYLIQEDAKGFGALMAAGHESLRALYEVSTPELDVLVEIALGLQGCLGARLTGAGFGGCTVNLVRQDCAERFVNILSDTYQKRINIQPQVYICKPARGAYVEQV